MRLHEPAQQQFTGHARRGRVFATCGAPGSGKTTWALNYVSADPHTRARVNRDLVRETIGCLPVGDGVQEGIVTIGCAAMVRAYLGAGLDVVIDDTLSRQRTLDELLIVTTAFQVPLTIVDFTGVPVGVCAQRDVERHQEGGRFVGVSVINALAEQCRAVLDRVPGDVEIVACPQPTSWAAAARLTARLAEDGSK